jgi:hypothetical protein
MALRRFMIVGHDGAAESVQAVEINIKSIAH